MLQRLFRTFTISCIWSVLTSFPGSILCTRSSVSGVTFLGYLGNSDESNATHLSAIVQVDGVLDDGVRRREWRASRRPDDCGGVRSQDYFDAREVLARVGGGEPDGEDVSDGETITVQVILPADLHDRIPGDAGLYLCTPTRTFQFGGEVIKWIPLGSTSVFFPPAITSDYLLEEDEPQSSKVRFGRIPRGSGNDGGEDPDDATDYDSEEQNISTVEQTIISHTRILALQLIEVSKYVSYGDDGVINVRQGFEVQLFVYGTGLSNDSEVKLTSSIAGVGHACKSHGLHVQTTSFPIEANEDGTFANLTIPAGTLPSMKGKEILYVCLRSNKTAPFLHQGTYKSLQIEVYDLLLPVWLMIVFILTLLSMSGLFSGLNLGLMALDRTELKIVQNTGSDREKNYANKIAPIRAHGNFLLCSLLLGNVLVNNTMTILLDSLTSGIVAVIGSTMAIVIFGEIIPQALCSRHGLAVGAHTIWLTKFFMLVTFPLAYPISKILDRILGAEIGTVYDKKRLIELLRVTRDKNDLEKEEVDIVTGALAFKEKTVRSCMTALRDVFMLNIKTTLDFETISEIRERGYSRIPVYDGNRENIVYVLLVKDLMFIDPDDNTPLAMVCEYYKNEVNFVFHDTPLNVMFNEFKSGAKGHMAFVQDVNDTGDGDPFYETIGIITLEDVIEEIIQQEIIDETDIVVDGESKQRRLKKVKLFSDFQTHANKVNVAPQLAMAVFQYMITSIEPFKPKHMNELVLKKLLTMDIFREVKIRKNQTNEDELVIIEKGKPIDYFILIVEGRVQASVGKEELVFESGPFSYYGLQVLSQVLDNPPSPVFGQKVTTPSSLINAATEGFSMALRTGSLRKTNTQLSFDVPHILNRRASSITGPAIQELGSGGLSRQNSAIFTHTFAPVIPDYTVKANTDVLYLQIKRATYLRALKATTMSKKPSPSEIELEKYLERVNEDDDMMPTPKLSSPDKHSAGILERAASFVSGRLTPTLSMRGGPDRLSGHSKRGLNSSFHNFDSDKADDRTMVEEEDETQEEEEDGEFWAGRSRSRPRSQPQPTSPTSLPSTIQEDEPAAEPTIESNHKMENNDPTTTSAGAVVINVRQNQESENGESPFEREQPKHSTTNGSSDQHF